jgi:hypothetical protein
MFEWFTKFFTMETCVRTPPPKVIPVRPPPPPSAPRKIVPDNTSTKTNPVILTEDDSFVDSVIIGAITNDAITGAVLGGSVAGGIVGDILNDGRLGSSCESDSNYSSGSSCDPNSDDF